ncbi:MAG: hypothetical protein HETSPECPRED_001145 [Heterodermia speciosa]|uniref:Uncharacterized protein n=1 Tax=Heterodermia speciosa TaxID=116794 RepID=A0A8H3J0Y0_9LECA|nr:MAG: hypothetical protein HETSPECPRED_001145 [Heterodermia speciosa]
MHFRRSNPLVLLGLGALTLFGFSNAQSTVGDGYQCGAASPDGQTNILKTSVLASTGKELRALVTITDTETVYTVTHGDELVYTHRGYGTADNTTVETTFGPKTWSGVSTMISKFTASDQILRGSIDGQEIAPFKKDATSAIANGPKLANGRAAPKAKQIANLTSADFQSLNEKVKSIPKECEPATVFEKPSRDLQARDLLLRRGDGLDRRYTIGYFPDTQTNLPCLSCLGSVDVDYFLALYVCGTTIELCAASFGIECAICWGAALSAAFGHRKACLVGPCCPTTCQEKNFFGGGQCCLKGETCLNADKGLCCKAEERPCGGKSCCHGSQKCVGPTGTCCPAEATCNGGKTCCPSGQRCVGGNTCCATEKVCGNKCCQDKPFALGYCANSAISLCCNGSKVEKNGICCEPNENNINGVCVDPRGKCGSHPSCSQTNDNCPFREHCNLSLGCCEDTIF